jgi:hypothetical protein
VATATSLVHFLSASLRALAVALSLACNKLTHTRELAKETVTIRQGKSIQKQKATRKKQKEKQRERNYVPLDSSVALRISRHSVPRDRNFCIKG